MRVTEIRFYRSRPRLLRLGQFLRLYVKEPHETYELDQPWITWELWQADPLTRITGRSTRYMTCCICGETEQTTIRIPRFGEVPIPEGGVHPVRIEVKARHDHPDQRDPADWALPLRNPQALGDLDLTGLLTRVTETAVMEYEDARREHNP
jgi:hypothetical protein